MIPAAANWRCFPNDSAAPAGQPFSPPYIHPGQTAGRFDLGDHPPVLYVSDYGAHVVAESLQAFRNSPFSAGMLRKYQHPLAVVEATVNSTLLDRLANLCDPEVLSSLGIAPDETAHHDRTVTQPLARRIYDAKYAGLRWWSTITGAWHTVALFTDRFDPGGVTFGVPRILAPTDVEVLEARRMLNIP